MLCDVRQGARREDDSDGVAFREVGEQECAWVAELDPEHEAVFRKRWRANHRCFAAETEGRCAGFTWAAVGPAVIDSGGVASAWRIPPGAAWKFDTYAHPLALGVAPELVWFQRRILRAEGIVTSISAVEYDNVASARLHLRMGARRAGSVTTVLALGLRLHLDRVQRRWRLRVGRSPFPLDSLAGRESPMEATQLAVGRTGL